MPRHYVWSPRGKVYHDDFSAQGYGRAECNANYFHRAGFGGRLYLNEKVTWLRGTRPPDNRDLCKRCAKLRGQ